jgi:23S rRNA (cytidine1920-2'-O)/16S rRNA (cytidine1409-2'-O)-methyltransferase
MVTKQKKRLDQLILEQNPALSRNYIQSLIMQGKVQVNDTVITKAGTSVALDANIILDIKEQQYVSRAGFKLEKALDYFDLDVKNMVVMDAGLSTGGFTDCLLQRGVHKVYGIDVGYGQVHDKIRNNPHVVVMERTNLRYVTSLPEKVDLVTLDLSFISVLKVIDAVAHLLKEHGKLLVLIKPQFEAERKDVGKGGIIKDDEVHQKVIEKVIQGISEHGFIYKGHTESPIRGTEGNKEFLAYFEKVDTPNIDS